MDLNGTKLFQALSSRMGWLGERQKTISENIANADTPRYRAKDMKTFDFEKQLRQTGPMSTVTTSDRHFSVSSTLPSGNVNSRAASYEETPDGNRVVIEEQMVKSAETQAAYDLALGIYRKNVGMMKTAIGGRQ